MADQHVTRTTIVQRETPLSRLAAVAAFGAALGASASAYVATRVVRRRVDDVPERLDPTEFPNPMGEAVSPDPPAAGSEAGESTVGRVVRRVDALQQRRSVLGFTFAVVKKFGDDSAGNLAALIAYYGFLSLFPLLLALTTILATVLQRHPDLQQRVLNSALAEFPVIGDQIRDNIHSLNGNAVALVVGIVGALWGGMGVMKAAGNAMDQVWEVPKRQRPNFLRALVRAALLLVVLGGGVVATTILSSLGTAGSGALWPLRIVGIVAAGIVDVALFLFAFRVLTVRDIALRDLLPGAVVAGVGWFVLQSIGGYYLTHTLNHATATYGMFAIVIGLLSWIYLQAQITLFAAEINVVRLSRLWPRSMATELTTADKRAYTAYAKVEERKPEVAVGVTFAGNVASSEAENGEDAPSPDVRGDRERTPASTST
jgi:membrane protein